MNVMTILGILLVPFLAQQPRPASIEGLVVKAGTSEPIAKAVVQLSGNGSAPVAMATGADGKFEFRNVKPGRYSLEASRAGFLDTAYGQRGPNGSGSTLPVESGQNIKDVRLTLIQTGAISGRVFDNSGEPLAHAPVRSLKHSYSEGQPKLTVVGSVETNDRGEYRLFWLPPGQYFISATSQSGVGDGGFMVNEGGATLRFDAHGLRVTTNASATDKLGEAYAPVYYPGTADPQGAAPVELRPGGDIGGIDFTLERVAMRKVRGILIGDQGQPVSPANVVLVPRGASLAQSPRGFAEADGSFEINGVMPGSYVLVASSRIVGGRGRAEGNNEVRTLAGRALVDVRGADLERISVIMSPPIDIPGGLVLEGSPAGLPEGVFPVGVLTSDLSGLGIVSQKHEFAATARFVIDSVVEGDYRLDIENLPKNSYLKSIRYGSADVLTDGLHIDSRSNDLVEVVLGSNGTVVDGVVTNKERKPVSNSVVALVPDVAHRTRGDLYRTARSDESGRFHLEGIAPGDYYLFAWEDIQEGLWRDPEFIRRNAASGRVVHINEGGRENIEITAIPFAY